MHLGFPLRLDGRGRLASVDDEEYLRGLVETALFTRPGERVNRPEFGSGVDQLLFAPGGDELAHTTQALVQAAVQQCLGDLLRVEEVTVDAVDAVLAVTVVYTPLLHGAPSGERRVLRIGRGETR
ncbi:GPW/gp25 family protein [Streptomyces sp. Caat 7-52]|uniref:GPW/gp25 family protein n=1 Tax=Streptomyces sp. Caat 7-52 TaxID=2949637 RepID=UPI0020353294|nr:GPW/gp25 family protein [Streptomyces sp. Caat 7-52]